MIFIILYMLQDILQIPLSIVFTRFMNLFSSLIPDMTGSMVSLVKNLLDATCVVTTILIGFVFSGKLIGIGIGTVLAVIFVGRVVAVGNYLFKNQITKMSGVKSD